MYLSEMLLARDVPLPKILAHDPIAECPWMAMERLPGKDLGDVITGLSNEQLHRIACAVADAQAITAQTGSAGLYGYAVLPEDAPHATWSQVLENSLSRSPGRIASAGLFDTDLVDIVQAKLAGMREDVNRIIATLHDTTTKNVIIAPSGKLSGIVDVDDLCFGDARYPAALTLAVLTAYYGGLDDYVSAWMCRAGHSVDRVFHLYVALFLLDLMSAHGHVFNGNNEASVPTARTALLEAFKERLIVIG